LMAWLALDRALRIAETHGARESRRRRWATERDAIADEVGRQGFDAERGTFTRAYGEADLDAALLLLPLIGFDPPASARVAGTVEAVRRELAAGGPFLFRYPPGTDGLEGGEGAFLPCSFWLVSALARAGRVDEAMDLFVEIRDAASDVGLYPEEVDPQSGAALGNYPQALTHAALVQAALALREAAPARSSGGDAAAGPGGRRRPRARAS
ncbi:MAG: glycoside hydrolase family 15 protein, partial [Actinobacteria bacterium]|nr:glycoside hydrolase family 15 protein [Actinomycetota bacterium]